MLPRIQNSILAFTVMFQQNKSFSFNEKEVEIEQM